jgi:cytoskeletal protein RodZ
VNKKKHGIVLGFTVIFIALIIWWISNLILSKKAENTLTVGTNQTSNKTVSKVEETKGKEDSTTVTPSTSDTQSTNSQTTTNQVNDTQSTTNQTTSSDTTTTTANEGVVKKFFNVNLSSLGEPTTHKANGVVTSKDLNLVQQKSGFQLQYFATITLEDGETLDAFLNETAFDSLNVLDKVVVDYKIYKNDSGIEFPLIISLATE